MKNSLAEKHPELVAEWSERNLPLTPMQNRRLPTCIMDDWIRAAHSQGLRLPNA